MMKRTHSLLLCILLLGTSAAAHAQESADVIVYGSTPGGFCAAIAAAREGASVILLEPTQHVGGMSTGGLSHCDSNQMRRETLLGLFDEWHRRVVKDYTDRGLPAPYDAALKDTAKWTFEPHVAMRVTLAMLKESGVIVKTGRYLKSVTKEGPRITALATQDGTFTAQVFVDGTYEGDLMAAAGVDWTIGREGRAEFDESYAGKRYPKKKMNVSGFDAQGELLPLVTTSDAGPDEAGDKNIMTYSFRLCLTRDLAKLVPMSAPTKYDPARFELARRALKVGVKLGFDLYPLPGNKLDGNNSIHGQISLGLVGGCNDWHSADEAGRQKIWEDHKQYTLEFLHFLRTDPAVPAMVRDQFADLGLCKDEFAMTDHFPPALYVRESRRMKGMVIGQGAGVAAALTAKRAVAVQDLPYPILRERLLAQGQVLKLPEAPKTASAKETGFIPVKSLPGLVLDDAEAELAGKWTPSTSFKPSIGSGYVVSGEKDARGDGKASATFRLKVPKAGEYKVLMAYSAHQTRAKNVPVIIVSGERETKLSVDQSRPLPEGKHFQTIGTVYLTAEGETTIQVKNSDAIGFVILDAVQLVPVK